MLVDLRLDKEKVIAWNKRIDECIIEYPDMSFESMRITDDSNSFSKRYARGFYSLSGHDLKKLSTFTKVKEYDSFQFDWHEYYKKHPNISEMSIKEKLDLHHERTLAMKALGKPRNNYGLCDNVEQIFKEYPELKQHERCFIIHVHRIDREDQPSWGGFRFHKHGKYIGDHNITCEYLYDQKDMDTLISYHIYEVEVPRLPKVTNRKIMRTIQVCDRIAKNMED